MQASPPSVTIHRQPVAAYVPISSQPFGVSDFDRYKPRLLALARAGGVSESTIAAVFPALSLNGRVIALDQSQPGQVRNPNYTPPFAPYRREHVTADLIRRGADRYRTYWPYLARIEQRFGVPSSIMLAIYGHETSYGSVTGGFDIVQALATLAYEGRRRPLFESEFVAALRLIDLGIPRWRLKGSYAGATGLPQFMPSAVIRLRTDGDGDGRAEIWTNEMDGLASIGNFLQQSGWRRGLLWGVPVRVPAGFDRNAVRRLAIATDCPRVHARHSRPLSMAQWRALGVVPLDRSLAEGDLATLFEPDGPGETAYLLTDNYRAILKYNCSNFYAMSVGLLADRIIGR